MAVVKIFLPASAEGAKYGRATIQAADDHGIDVPAYVAKQILTLPGVTGPAQAQSSAALLAAADEDFECNYLFWAFGQPLPEADRLAAAAALLTANGDPAVALV